VAARLKAPGGDQWYVFKALQTIMQMSGRGVRSETDFCDCYILDQQFTGLLARTRQYVPAWWMEAIRRIESL
jgi:Rad3-related DNA helicase